MVLLTAKVLLIPSFLFLSISVEAREKKKVDMGAAEESVGDFTTEWRKDISNMTIEFNNATQGIKNADHRNILGNVSKSLSQLQSLSFENQNELQTLFKLLKETIEIVKQVNGKESVEEDISCSSKQECRLQEQLKKVKSSKKAGPEKHGQDQMDLIKEISNSVKILYTSDGVEEEDGEKVLKKRKHYMKILLPTLKKVASALQEDYEAKKKSPNYVAAKYGAKAGKVIGKATGCLVLGTVQEISILLWFSLGQVGKYVYCKSLNQITSKKCLSLWFRGKIAATKHSVLFHGWNKLAKRTKQNKKEKKEKMEKDEENEEEDKEEERDHEENSH